MSIAARLGRAVIAGWNRLWFALYDPLPAALMRISLGLLQLAMYLALTPSFGAYFGRGGVLSLDDASLPREPEDWWSVLTWLPGVPMAVFWGVGLVAALAFTVGWRTRWSTAALWILENSLVHRNRFAVSGEDFVLQTILFYGLFAPLGDALSLDEWRRRRRTTGSPPNVPQSRLQRAVWPIRLMQINVALIYVISLPNKLAGDIAWQNGDALYYVIVSDLWSRFPWPWMFYGALSDITTWFTILVEGSFPVLVWFRRTRPYSLALIASLHLGIAFMLKNVAFFSVAMLACFWLFVPASTIRWAGSRLVCVARAARGFWLSNGLGWRSGGRASADGHAGQEEAHRAGK